MTPVGEKLRCIRMFLNVSRVNFFTYKPSRVKIGTKTPFSLYPHYQMSNELYGYGILGQLQPSDSEVPVRKAYIL